MAICFVRAKVVSRGGGGSAVAAAAYRSGEKIRDEATGKTHDYTKKQGVDHSEILTPFAVANGKPFAATAGNEWLTNRSALWNRVESAEKRYDAQLAREIIIAIPCELKRSDQIALVREYVQNTFVDRGMIADINIHHLDGNNPHAHVMLTMRELKIDEQGTVSFGKKDRTWNDKKLLETQIKEWEVIANQYLERTGLDTRIDSRSYEEQGIARIPQIHLGKNVTAMRRQGIPTERGDLYDQIEQTNQDIRQNLEKIYQAEGVIHNRNLGTDHRHRAVGNSHSEDIQNRPEPAGDQTRQTGSANRSNPDFAAIQAELIELSNQARDPGAGEVAPEQYQPNRGELLRWYGSTRASGDKDLQQIALEAGQKLAAEFKATGQGEVPPRDYSSPNVVVSADIRAQMEQIVSEQQINVIPRFEVNITPEPEQTKRSDRGR